MISGKTFLAIIPARGGSKRLPRKNVLNLVGKPLIAWTIQAAKESKYLDDVIVSTDDNEISTLSMQYGIENVVARPPELASDTATSFDVIKHAMASRKKKYDYVMLLQPTSPLRKSYHIDDVAELVIEKNANAVISVCEAEHSPLWCNTLPEDDNMDGFIPDKVKNKRSQDLPRYYRLNGAIYCADAASIVESTSLFSLQKTFAYKMDVSSSIDIDSSFDFSFAERLLEKKFKDDVE